LRYCILRLEGIQSHSQGKSKVACIVRLARKSGREKI
jgi:hypothetical protein